MCVALATRYFAGASFSILEICSNERERQREVMNAFARDCTRLFLYVIVLTA